MPGHTFQKIWHSSLFGLAPVCLPLLVPPISLYCFTTLGHNHMYYVEQMQEHHSQKEINSPIFEGGLIFLCSHRYIFQYTSRIIVSLFFLVISPAEPVEVTQPTNTEVEYCINFYAESIVVTLNLQFYSNFTYVVSLARGELDLGGKWRLWLAHIVELDF